MTTPLTTRLMLLLAALVTAAGYVPAKVVAAPPSLGWASAGRVVSVNDGDTVTFEITTRINVRLIAAWCPELDTQEGKSAKRYVEAYALGKPAVLFVPHGKRQLGDSTTMSRVLGSIWIDGEQQSLSELLVEAKYATKEKPK